MTVIHRRSFLRRTGAAVAAAPLLAGAAPKGGTVALALDGADPVASARPALKAAHVLQQELGRAGYAVQRCQYLQQAARGARCIVASGSTAPVAAGMLAAAHAAQPMAPETLALVEMNAAGRDAILACGADPRGLAYALYELADRVRCGAALRFPKPVAERPAVPVRSVMRQFVSETYDKPWFYDRTMWPQYCAMLAARRFNRLHLAFGLGYDALKNVADAYFLFPYPFLIAVPGYDVKAASLPDTERDRNLQTLRYIGDTAAASGLDFELGLWMHGYQWPDSPGARYTIEGLTPETHGFYCRDALAALLKALPAVSSVGLRIHGESGVAEGSYDFWRLVFDGVARAGRRIEIDLHAKGIDDRMIADALATGMPVNVAPKFSAEHLGLPYHQAEIRPSEIPSAGEVGKGLMTLSEGQRSFTRYGYADLMRDDRKYTVRPRVFAGTQRILASGNAAASAAYAKAFRFCGMEGADLMEPLTYRGRRGSASASPRDGYAAQKLQTKYDWQKYEYWYRSSGRTMFNPDTDPEVFARTFEPALRAALENASRILPLVTSAHSESAACDLYWPEVYWNLPMASEAGKFFWDTPSPRTFQNVTALDPQLFSSCSEFAGELLGERSGKYSPAEVAQWLDGFAAEAEKNLAAAGAPGSVDAMRLAVDIEVQALLGRFFAAKLRAGVLMALHERNPDRVNLTACLAEYRKAREHWAKIVERTRGVYAADLSVSDRFTERGQWSDRLKDIDADIAALEARLATVAVTANDSVGVRAVFELQGRKPLDATHTPPADFTPGRPVALAIAVARKLSSARLWYRHVNQAERWIAAEMTAQNGSHAAAIPAAYTDSPYPLQYYFELRAAPAQAWLHPGFDEQLLNQPYFALQRN